MTKRVAESERQKATRATGRKLGIPARDLRDADLERELHHLWRTRQETILHGSANAIRAHTDRMLELEHEYIARFPRKTQAAEARTRRGARARGQRPVRQERTGSVAPRKSSRSRQPK